MYHDALLCSITTLNKSASVGMYSTYIEFEKFIVCDLVETIESVCHIPHVERDNAVYWKTKRKIKNDLQCTTAPTTPPLPATRVQL